VSAYRLRAASEADLPAIVAIDQACFARPWPVASWQAELSRPFCTISVACDATDDAIVGLAFDWCLPPDPAHLLRIATLPAWRGRGIAWDLLCAVIARAQNAGCSAVMLEVGRSNVAARRLYERAAFATIDVRPRYYPDPPDDALVMRRTTQT
jgi:ribosomal-protein-alanine N-acetyltransferase